ncbi:hypothetical protein ACLOJK_026651, partial [Asimina triloba]
AHVHKAACARGLQNGAHSVLHHPQRNGWQPWLPPLKLLPPATLRPTTLKPAGEAAADRPSSPDDDQLHLVVDRKPTLITAATRGESSSPVINKFNSIPLRSWPISDLTRAIFQSIFLWIIPLISIQEWVITAAAQSVFFPSSSGHPFSQMSLPPFLVFNEAWISGSRPFIMLATVPIICQHAHEPARCHGHRLARADCRRRCPHVCLHCLSHRLPAARRSLPPHRHHLPAARTVHQRSRLHDLSRQQPGKHASG